MPNWCTFTWANKQDHSQRLRRSVIFPVFLKKATVLCRIYVVFFKVFEVKVSQLHQKLQKTLPVSLRLVAIHCWNIYFSAPLDCQFPFREVFNWAAQALKRTRNASSCRCQKCCLIATHCPPAIRWRRQTLAILRNTLISTNVRLSQVRCCINQTDKYESSTERSKIYIVWYTGFGRMTETKDD